ncbi:hypothetical protein KOF112_16930 [Bacillus velezensis]|nr:hypothetical protein KOF112_16930 [Bacillus velezensis]
MWGDNLSFTEKTLLEAGFFVFKLNTSLGYLVTNKKIQLEGWEKHENHYSNVVKLERG